MGLAVVGTARTAHGRTEPALATIGRSCLTGAMKKTKKGRERRRAGAAGSIGPAGGVGNTRGGPAREGAGADPDFLARRAHGAGGASASAREKPGSSAGLRGWKNRARRTAPTRAAPIENW